MFIFSITYIKGFSFSEWITQNVLSDIFSMTKRFAFFLTRKPCRSKLPRLASFNCEGFNSLVQRGPHVDGSWLYRVHGGCSCLEKFGKTKVGVLGCPSTTEKLVVFCFFLGGVWYMNIPILPELRFDKLPKKSENMGRTWRKYGEHLWNVVEHWLPQ